MAPFRHESSFEYTPAIARSFARSMVWHEYFVLPVLCGATTMFAALCLTVDRYHWVSGFAFGVALAMWARIFRAYLQAAKSAREYAGQRIALVVDDSGVQLVTPTVNSHSTWAGFASARRASAGLLLFSGPLKRPVAIPQEALDEATIAFVLDHVKKKPAG